MTDNNSNQADACNKYEDMPDAVDMPIHSDSVGDIYDASDMYVCSVDFDMFPLNKEVAKYLCHAANHHQALVQALEWAQEYFKECGIGSHKVDDALAAAKMLDANAQEEIKK